MSTVNIKGVLLLLAGFFVWWVVFPPGIPAEQLPAQDVVFLVDCSESAAPYLSSIGGIMSRFVGGASVGDSFTCYQFSSAPVLIARRKIENRTALTQLQSQLVQLRATGRSTNYSPALQKGLAEIAFYYDTQRADDKLLILITDGREAGAQGESTSFGELLKEYSTLKAERDYSFYCFYIGDWPEADLRSYLQSAGAHLVSWRKDQAWLDRLTLSDIRVMNRAISLGEIPDVPTQGAFSVSLYPRRVPKGINMIELTIEAPFTKETLDRLFDVRTRRIVCKQGPWTEPFGFETRGFKKGLYGGTFIFRSADPQTTLLFPQFVNFSFSIAESLSVMVPEFLNFGPTGFEGDYEEKKTISITPRGADFPDSIDALSVSSDVKLPDGVQLSLSPGMREKEIIVTVAVARHERLSKQAAGKYEGKIRLSSLGGWAFTNTEIPISVNVSEQAFNFTSILIYGGIAGVLILGVVGLVFAVSNVKGNLPGYLSRSAYPVGKLVIISDPTKGIVKNVNLRRLAEKKHAKELFAGSGEDVDIEMPHTSMLDRAYKISGLRAEGGITTVVEAVRGGREVLVNDKSRTGQVQLRHLDTLKMGAFEFRYELPRPLQQVVLYFLDGVVSQGWLISWSIQAEGFRFLNRENLPSREESFVRFYQLKAAAFVRDFEGEVTKSLLSPKVPHGGHKVRVSFADQEEITGYVFDWKNLTDKFYLIPDSMGPNVMFFLIERHTLKSINLVKENAIGAMRAQKKFNSLLERMNLEQERSL